MTIEKRDNTTTSIDRPEWLSEAAWPFQMRTVGVANSPIAYTDEGSGPALLLVHDGMCSYLWVHLIDLLKDRYRVVTLDFPGSGLSPTGNTEPSLQSDSVLLEAFVSAIGLDRFTLVAHDLGGGVGLGLAIRRPELVSGLVLINTFAWPPETAGLRAMLRLMGSRPMSALATSTNVVARASSGRFGVGRNFTKTQRRAFVSMFAPKTSRQRFHQLMASATREGDYLKTVEESLASLADRPALTIFGKRNDPFRFQQRWLEHFPRAEQMVIPGGYHFPMCDAPEAVASAVIGLNTSVYRGQRTQLRGEGS